MAELHVQPKSSKPWWIWLLLALLVVGALYYFLRDDNDLDNDDVEVQEPVGSILIPADQPEKVVNYHQPSLMV